MKPLGSWMNPEEQAALSSLAYLPGFPILKRLMEEACEQATAEVIKVDPKEPNYDAVLKSMQQEARATHRFSANLLKSIELHKQATAIQKAQEELTGKPKEPKVAGVVNESKAAVGNPLGRTTIQSKEI